MVDIFELPGGWVRYEPPDGRPYYHNAETGATQWDAPTEVDLSRWQKTFDEDGTPYYYDQETQETRWDPPPGWQEEEEEEEAAQ